MPKHFFLEGWSKSEAYSYPGIVRSNVKTPSRDRSEHGLALKKKFEKAWAISKERGRKFAVVSGTPQGFYTQFESSENYLLDLEKLDLKSLGVEVVSVTNLDKVERATVFIPEGSVHKFLKKIEEYLDPSKDSYKSGSPRNKSLVDSISDLRLASLESFWTDEYEPMPNQGESIWWEIWLRNDSGKEVVAFRNLAKEIGIDVGEELLSFPDRSVVVAYASPEKLSKSLDLLKYFAELRRARESATFFANLVTSEQAEWTKELLSRTQIAGNDAPTVCVLDTGISNGHPLLAASLAQIDMHCYKPEWRANDHHGHGTEMAGVALFGNLSEALASKQSIQLFHRLESVKILPPVGANPPHLYGYINKIAAIKSETSAPERKRVFLMAVTADPKDRGTPSSWSAAVDQLASNFDNQASVRRRLFVLSAGNRIGQPTKQYFEEALTESIHNPGQSWNSLTVGAYTKKIIMDNPNFRDWTPLAQRGELAPRSTTSTVWAKQWPLKPDIVMEGGNYAISPNGEISGCDSMSLLTSYFQISQRLFTTTCDTSAAAALAANMAATIQAHYPNAWAETIRAIIIHSARWLPEMKKQAGYDDCAGRRNLDILLRCFGFGTPDLRRALESTSNALTMVSEGRIYPLEEGTKRGTLKSREMILHSLPWPKVELEQLGSVEVRLRVTLSYFIEPNPGKRGWRKRHRYASHGLRFEVKKATETLEQFRCRVNKQAREEDAGNDLGSSSDSNSWLLGPQLRNKGSVHSDIWVGTAQDLAERGYIGIYPVTGWWKEKPNLNRWQNGARYSLIVSIETDDTSIDLYVSVSNQINAKIQSEILLRGL